MWYYSVAIILVIVKGCLCFRVRVDFVLFFHQIRASYIGRVMAAEDVDYNVIVHLQIRCYEFVRCQKEIGM
jgi:hypothetical protein